MGKLEKIQQKLIDNYGNNCQTILESNRLHIAYKDGVFKPEAVIRLCANGNLRIYPDMTWLEFKNVSSIIDYLKLNIIGE